MAALVTAGPSLGSQAVPRADLPGAGVLRVTVDPRIEWWDQELVDGARMRLGAGLRGDSGIFASPAIPDLVALQDNIRSAGAFPGFVARLGAGRLSVLSQRRATPLTLEFGLTDRIALGVAVPVVRTFVRTSFALDTTGNVGLNPLFTDPGAAATYDAFFADFDAALAALGCTAASCPDPFLAGARGVRDALRRSVYGTGAEEGTPFLPRAGSVAAAAVDSNLAAIQRQLRDTYADSSFTATFLFPDSPLDAAGFATVLADPAAGYGVRPFGNTPLDERFWLGDVEVAARVRAVSTPSYTATLGALVRLPTGHLPNSGDMFPVAAGDHQTDIEGQLVQELTLGTRLWLNLSLRAGIQRPGVRARRLAPPGALLVRPQTVAELAWDPGDYVAADFAPLFRFHRWFAAGFTAAYYARGADSYRYRSAADSVDIAARVGTAVPAAVLDAQTATRSARVGIAASFVGPRFESGLSVERTVSAPRGRVPAGWTFRLVLRASRKVF